MEVTTPLLVALLLTSQEGTMKPLPTKSADEVVALLARARAKGFVKTARKSRPVDARPARPGEIVVTVINGEKETQSKPAQEGDWVVRNRCPETGNEQYLVSAKTFAERYKKDAAAGAGGWQGFRPLGKKMRFLIVTPEDGSFTFKAPWGEDMVAHPGDALVQDPENEKDTYRVEKAAFACTYEIVK
jgi:hypothetical protein